MPKHDTQREYHFPLQLIFALKEKNGGKLNSHLWLFMGIAGQLNPKYVMLVDVGTVPRKESVTSLYVGCEADPQIGGCCGEIAVRNMKPYSFLDSIQNFEYIVNHVLDKSMESMFGMIPVLPGAFRCGGRRRGGGGLLFTEPARLGARRTCRRLHARTPDAHL